MYFELQSGVSFASMDLMATSASPVKGRSTELQEANEGTWSLLPHETLLWTVLQSTVVSTDKDRGIN